MMKKVVSLSRDSAIERIKNTPTVYFKSGVWNSYGMQTTEYACARIMNSGYGADVYYNDENDMYYVSVPSDGDMF